MASAPTSSWQRWVPAPVRPPFEVSLLRIVDIWPVFITLAVLDVSPCERIILILLLLLLVIISWLLSAHLTPWGPSHIKLIFQVVLEVEGQNLSRFVQQITQGSSEGTSHIIWEIAIVTRYTMKCLLLTLYRIFKCVNDISDGVLEEMRIVLIVSLLSNNFLNEPSHKLIHIFIATFYKQRESTSVWRKTLRISEEMVGSVWTLGFILGSAARGRLHSYLI